MLKFKIFIITHYYLMYFYASIIAHNIILFDILSTTFIIVVCYKIIISRKVNIFNEKREYYNNLQSTDPKSSTYRVVKKMIK